MLVLVLRPGTRPFSTLSGRNRPSSTHFSCSSAPSAMRSRRPAPFDHIPRPRPRQHETTEIGRSVRSPPLRHRRDSTKRPKSVDPCGHRPSGTWAAAGVGGAARGSACGAVQGGRASGPSGAIAGGHQARAAPPAAETGRRVEVPIAVAKAEVHRCRGRAHHFANAHGVAGAPDRPIEIAIRRHEAVVLEHHDVHRAGHQAAEADDTARNGPHRGARRDAVFKATVPGAVRTRRGNERPRHRGVNGWWVAGGHECDQQGCEQVLHSTSQKSEGDPRPAGRGRSADRGLRCGRLRPCRWQTCASAAAAPPWGGSGRRGSRSHRARPRSRRG